MIVAADIGARFVDLAIAASGSVSAGKHPVGRDLPAAAILSALDTALARDREAISGICDMRVGSTGLINVLLDREGPRIGLVTNAGFGDLLSMGRQNRANLHDPVTRSPAPTFLVDRGDVAEVGGRIAADGHEAQPLDLAGLEAAACRFAEAGITSVAVCLLFAHLKPAHERACEAALRRVLPGADICLSHRVDPQAREYERTVSTALEAWLRPRGRAMIAALQSGLEARGFRGTLSFCDGRGALLPADVAGERVSSLLPGGAAAAALAGRRAARAAGAGHAICMDIGSSSTDLAIVEAGELARTHESTLAGVPLRQAMIDVESRPHGGRRTYRGTVLDDALGALGLLPPAGDRRTGLSAADVAAVVNEAKTGIAEVILRHAVRRNVDPAVATLVAMGGLGGLLAQGVAETLGITRIVLPPAPAVAGALGLLDATPLREARLAIGRALDDIDATLLEERLSALARSLNDGAPTPEATVRFSARMAPDANMHTVVVDLGTPLPTVSGLRAALEHHFRAHHGVGCPGPGFLHAMELSLSPSPADSARQTPISRIPARNDGWLSARPLDGSPGSIDPGPGWTASALADGHVLLSRDTRRG